MSKRVILAGIFHETHTFLEGETTLADFTRRDGDAMFAARGDGSPLAGVLEVAEEHAWNILPVIDLRATPSAIVADNVVDVFWEAFQETVHREQERGIDGVCLVLHGAMTTRSLQDVEGELLRRLRALPALARVPVCGVLDLHGNISPDTIELADGMIAYRRNPHTDACAAGAAAAAADPDDRCSPPRPLDAAARPLGADRHRHRGRPDENA